MAWGTSDVVPDHMWMSSWGLLSQPKSQFLAGRGVRAVAGMKPPVDFPAPKQIQQQSYNPSLALLPMSVREQLNCSECVYLASVRVDWMTQCQGFQELLRFRQRKAWKSRFGARKGTLIMLLDADWEPLHWGWLQWAGPGAPFAGGRAQPERPLSARWLFARPELDAMIVMVDVRLVVVREHLYLVGSMVQKDYQAAFVPLHLHLSDRAGHLSATSRRSEMKIIRHPMCSGRSQTFFEWGGTAQALHPTTRQSNSSAAGAGNRTPIRSPTRPRLLFQSWLVPSVTCELRYNRLAPSVGAGPNGAPSVAMLGAAAAPVSEARTLHGVSEGVCALVSRGPARTPAEACRLSLNGVSVRLADGQVLGIGHVHRGHRDTLLGKPLARNLTYFAHHYTHFFYLQDPTPPAFRVLKLGSEFCIGTERRGRTETAAAGRRRAGGGKGAAGRSDAGGGAGAGNPPPPRGLDCEVVQYVTGMLLREDVLTLSYGSNDCTSKLVDLVLSDVLEDLQELPGADGADYNESKQ